MKITLRNLHRWLGFFAGLQLLAWTVSGLYFTLIPIEEIRGNHLLTKEKPKEPTLGQINLISPTEIAIRHPEIAKAKASDLRVSLALGTPVYLIGNQRFDAATGNALPRIDKQDAIKIINARFHADIIDVELVEHAAIDSEYRNGEFPAWKANLAEENAAIYVGLQTGRIRAIRTDSWRLFDFLWSLHIMDYEERENFNHLLIQSLAALSLITVLSGLALFFTTLRFKSRQPETQDAQSG